MTWPGPITPRSRPAGQSGQALGRGGQPVRCADGLARIESQLAVFRDGTGDLRRARAALAWYPRDIWLCVLAGQWQRIGQEEAFPGRCAEAGDDLGSAVVTARLARDLMRLMLLMRRRYPPYSKWLGSAFARLPEAATAGPALRAAVTAAGWPAREHHLVRAYRAAAVRHNELGLTEPLDPGARPYFGRPFQVIGADRFSGALRSAITDPAVRALPPLGGVDTFIDSTDAQTRPGFLRAAVDAALRAWPVSSR